MPRKTKADNSLIRKLAFAYAFVLDMRELALAREDLVYIRKTSGIENSISIADELYPRVFRKYFDEARELKSKTIEKK